MFNWGRKLGALALTASGILAPVVLADRAGRRSRRDAPATKKVSVKENWRNRRRQRVKPWSVAVIDRREFGHTTFPKVV